MPEEEFVARALAYARWPLANDDVRARWAEKEWPVELPKARLAIAAMKTFGEEANDH